MKISIALAAACLGMPAAGTSNYAHSVPFVLVQTDGEAVQSAPLEGSEWRVQELDGKKVVEGVVSTLAFSEGGVVSGSGGCNRFRGSVKINGTAMKFSPLATTMMACEEEKSRQEAHFHAALEKTASYSLQDGQLKLIDATGNAVARLEKL
ncbi:MAG: META domain-containing protein [Rhizobiaceae bacterium]|nr:META domain-containing protein [Rhizobiaceae bacterium]